MRETVFGKKKDELFSDLLKAKVIMASAVAAAAVLNAMFLMLRNGDNHIIMLVLNIAADTLALWFVTAFYDSYYFPRRMLARLMKQNAQKTDTRIISLEPKSETRRKLNCLHLNTENGVFYLPVASALTLCEGERIVLYTVSGIVVEVERV